MKGPESRFSREFAAALKRRPNVFAFRIESSHTCPGLPDWCLVIDSSRVIFVELKAGSSLTPAQVIVHEKLRKLNAEIYVLTKTINGVKVDNTEPKPLEYVIDTLVENGQ